MRWNNLYQQHLAFPALAPCPEEGEKGCRESPLMRIPPVWSANACLPRPRRGQKIWLSHQRQGTMLWRGESQHGLYHQGEAGALDHGGGVTAAGWSHWELVSWTQGPDTASTPCLCTPHPPTPSLAQGRRAPILGPGLLLQRCFSDLPTKHPLAQVLLDLDWSPTTNF